MFWGQQGCASEMPLGCEGKFARRARIRKVAGNLTSVIRRRLSYTRTMALLLGLLHV